MVNIALAFVTGLTTGGLSCLAVQGGLLASSLAGQIEKDVQAANLKQRRKKTRRNQKNPVQRTALVQPILAFLAAKLLAYTLMGFLLGAAGQMFQLSPFARAFLQIAIGIYMLGAALRLLNVHPIFRYFVFEPPAFLRRFIRQKAAQSADSLAAPVFLGLLTVFIPCGITQAMMAAALSTANLLEGAALMFAFTLGTSPVFFAVAYFATQLGARLERHFMRIVAVVMLVLGIYAIDTGLTLAGSPVSITRSINTVLAQAGSPPAGFEQMPPGPGMTGALAVDPYADDEGVITINVENTGYDPSVVQAPAEMPLRLRLVSNDVFSCSLVFVIPALNFQAFLKSTGEAWVDIPAQRAGTRMPFACSMGMYTGVIIFN
ncbi:MAG TPA: sulfite exporter TauE/SafE family protein [Levilinea sp.]|nr:sulfite exporter TauE/SafE family protein [Levilinea sp.]